MLNNCCHGQNQKNQMRNVFLNIGREIDSKANSAVIQKLRHLPEEVKQLQGNQMMERNKILEEIEGQVIKLQWKKREIKEKHEYIENQIRKMFGYQLHLKVIFTFNPQKCEGIVEWMEASKYLFYGHHPPVDGFGPIAMEYVMDLYGRWMDPKRTKRNGIVKLLDVSTKYVDNAFWDQLRALSIWRWRITLIYCQNGK